MANGTLGADPARLTLGRAVIFSLAGLPVSALGVALLIYLPPHLSGHLGVPLAVVGGAWATVRILDVAIDPVLGVFMDRTRTRWGRYRPWMVVGAPILMVAAYMLFLAEPGISRLYLIFWLLVLYLAQSILHLALPAWGATLAKTYNERARIYGVMAAVGVLCAVAILVLPVVNAGLHRTEAQGVQAMGWFIILLTPLVVALTVSRIGETVAPDAGGPKVQISDYVALLTKPDLVRLYLAHFALTLGPGWMSALYLFFAKDYMKFTASQASILLLVYISAGLIGAPVTAWVATRIGKHRTMMGAAALYSIGLCGVLLPPKGIVLASMPVMLWCGAMGAAFELMIRAMLADVADEVRLEQGKERLSLIYALNTLSTKIAAAFSIGISFPLLQAMGYVAKGRPNTPEAITALGWVFISGPIFFVMLGGACVFGWKMTAARHAEIRIALDARDAEAALGIVDG